MWDLLSSSIYFQAVEGIEGGSPVHHQPWAVPLDYKDLLFRPALQNEISLFLQFVEYLTTPGPGTPPRSVRLPSSGSPRHIFCCAFPISWTGLCRCLPSCPVRNSYFLVKQSHFDSPKP